MRLGLGSGRALRPSEGQPESGSARNIQVYKAGTP
jgi:hypothetical protein